MKTLLDAASLHGRITSGRRTVILDVRWALGDPRGHEHYLAGHIPGAVYVDLETELAAPATPEAGRHPLPLPEEFQEHARRWGINEGDSVVAYDDVGNASAARAWWLLRHAGFDDVALLDGGLSAWREAGLPTEGGAEQPSLGNITLGWDRMPTTDADTAARAARTGVLMDARAAERYSGAAEPVDPAAGHIPGAISVPTAANLADDGKFLSAEELRARFSALGPTAPGPTDPAFGDSSDDRGIDDPSVDDRVFGDRAAGNGAPVTVYCGSGITAAHEVFALHLAGLAAALYPGSWSQWSRDTARPVATGAEPG